MPHPGPKGRCSVNIPQLILSIVDVAAAIFLIAVVLLQSGKSAGLSGAIAGVADTFMAKNRAKTWDAKLAKLVHAAVGMTAANAVIAEVGKVDAAASSAVAAVLLLVIYGGYFLATCWGSRRIVRGG